MKIDIASMIDCKSPNKTLPSRKNNIDLLKTAI